MQSNFVALLNSEINFILIEKLSNKRKKVSQLIWETFHLNQIIYRNYYFVNSKNKVTSTSFATPAPVGSYLIL